MYAIVAVVAQACPQYRSSAIVGVHSCQRRRGLEARAMENERKKQKLIDGKAAQASAVVEATRASAVEGSLVPVNMPATQPDASTASHAASHATIEYLVAPKLPTTTDQWYKCDVPALMTKVIAYTRDAIPKCIGAHPSLASQHGRCPFWKCRR